MKANPEEFLIEPLEEHDRAAFSCGNEQLDNYIRCQASQDQKKKLAVVFVAVEKSNPMKVVGFYTLSNREIPLKSIPLEIAKKAGRYNSLPVTLIGRMASSPPGRGIGELILIDALKRSLNTSRQVGSFAVFVEAKDERAASFYQKFGFIELPDDNLKLFLPMATIEKLP